MEHLLKEHTRQPNFWALDQTNKQEHVRPKYNFHNPGFFISRQHSAQIVRRKSHATFPLIVGRWSIFWKVKSNKYGGHLSTTQHSLGTPKSLCHAPCTILNMTANTLLSKSFHLHFHRLITFHLTFKPKRNILITGKHFKKVKYVFHTY